MKGARSGSKAASPAPHRRRDKHARPRRTSDTMPTYDLAIVGAGPAGLAAAELATQLGARVALLERHRLGGTSLNCGSVPSKALIRSATLFAGIREAARLQGSEHSEPVADLKRVVAHLRQIEGRIGSYHSLERLKRMGIDVYFDAARFIGPQSVATSATRLAFDKALVATGARPALPNIPGLAEGQYLTSESVFELAELPRHLAVVGGGPLGCELAQAFCRLGSRVTIIQDEAKFLPREERDAAQIVAQSMARDGVTIYLNTTVVGARLEKESLLLDTDSCQIKRQVAADRVLVSVGRIPNVDALGLEAAGVSFDPDHGIAVDEFLRTTNPSIYAAGDVCMPNKYTHVAESTARIAVRNSLRRTRLRHTDLTIPWCTFCAPEVAHVGLQVWEARARSIPIKTFTVMMQDVDRAITDRQDMGFVKLHVAERHDRILGATIVASRASEMINEVCVAMSTGIGLRALAEVIHTYPSQSAAIRLAAMSLEEPRRPRKIAETSR
jgi:pyruvate/2-oxoglutarate dehydrogenase complex dihydrolipoamide dehydrogenase (E3) component